MDEEQEKVDMTWKHDVRPSARFAVLAPLMFAGAFTLAGCGDSTGPSIDTSLVVGTYAMTALSFDPQGSLPAIDINARLNTSVQLIVSNTGALQIVYQDPVSNLFTTIQGTYRGTEDGVRIDFASNSAYDGLLLSRRMDFAYDSTTTTLSFNAASPDGANRQRLLQLAPELANEQLLDPTPGTLHVTFKR
jgi:hypothetical protein